LVLTDHRKSMTPRHLERVAYVSAEATIGRSLWNPEAVVETAIERWLLNYQFQLVATAFQLPIN
jgi:hypothetical protein